MVFDAVTELSGGPGERRNRRFDFYQRRKVVCMHPAQREVIAKTGYPLLFLHTRQLLTPSGIQADKKRIACQTSRLQEGRSIISDSEWV